MAASGLRGDIAGQVLASLRKEIADRVKSGVSSSEDAGSAGGSAHDFPSGPRADQVVLPSNTPFSVGDLADGVLESRVRGLEYRSEGGYHSDRATAARMEAEHGLLRAELERRAGGMPEPAVLRDAALARVELAKPGTSVPTAFRHVLALAKEAVAKGHRFAKFAVETGRAFGRKVGQHLRSAWDSAMHWWHRNNLRYTAQKRVAEFSQIFDIDPPEPPPVGNTNLSRIYKHPDLQHHTSMSDCIEHIRNLAVEVGAIYTTDSWMEEARIGTRSRVVMLAQLIKDSWFVHNHPNGGTFSFRDYRLMIEEDGAGMVAATKEGTYFVERPSRGWPTLGEMKRVFANSDLIIEAQLDEFKNSYTGSDRKAKLHEMEIQYYDELLHERLRAIGIEVRYEALHAR